MLKKTTKILLLLFSVFSLQAQPVQMKPVVKVDLETTIGQFRAVTVDLNGKKAICALYSEDAEIDPFIGMFFFPEHTLKLVLFDESGEILWKRDLDEEHIDTGWVARLGENGEPIVLGVKVGAKIRTAEGERRTGVVEYTYEAFSGKPVDLGFNVYTSIPVDLNGNVVHELVKGYFEGDGTVIDNKGNVIGNVGGLVAMTSKFTSRHEEQILSYSKDRKITIWSDMNAKDSPQALKRYEHPFYLVNQKQTGNGYNLFTLGGI